MMDPRGRLELVSDIECGACHRVFNAKRGMTDRMILAMAVDDQGKAKTADIVERPTING